MVNAYIANQASNTVSVLDTATNTVTATINVGSDPSGVAVSPDGSKAYVTNFGGSTVSVINTSNNTVSNTLTVGSSPWGVTFTPDGSKAYVANAGSNTISPINVLNNTVGTAITVGTEPVGVAITPDGSTAYITNENSYNISVIDIASNTVSTTISLGTGNKPGAIAITPDGSTAYVGDNTNSKVLPINLSNNTIGTGITVGSAPAAIAITSDGSKAYVANETANSVSVINISNNTVSSTITVNNPEGISITPDGKYAYVTNTGNNTVSIIDTSTDTLTGTTITVGSSPVSFGQFIQPPTQSTGADMPAPQGRLTLSSTAPVMTADATAQSTIYYLPYQGPITPVYNGSAFVNQLLGSSGISLALDSNSGHTGYQASGSLFDIFGFMNSGTLTLGTGPAWTNSTTRSAALTQVSGIWVNSASITLRFGSASGNTASVSANQATYLGTMYATANGQTGMACFPTAASGGTNNILGLWNAYNRVPITAQCLDSTVSWTYTTATVRPANNSTSNRISFVDGLGQSNFIGSYNQTVYNASSAGYEVVGVGVNSTTSGGVFVSEGSGSTQNAVYAQHNSYPIMGFNYIQALEEGDGTHAATFYGGGANLQLLTLQISM